MAKREDIALINAIKSGDMPQVEALLFAPNKRERANPKTKEKGQSALRIAVQYGDCSIIELLIRAGADLKETDSDGNSLLFAAIQAGELDAMDCLLSRNADVNLAKSPYKFTPLHMAACYGLNEAMKLLISKGAGVDKKTRYNQTPLFWAINNKHMEAVVVLYLHKAKMNLKDEFGQTPLKRAQSEECPEIVQFLEDPELWLEGAEERVDPEVSAFHQAAQTREIGVVERFLSKNREILDEPNPFGRTVLHIAAERGNVGLLELLIGIDANVNVSDYEGSTPLHVAVMCGRLEVTNMLLSAGANIDIANVLGETPLHLAARKFSTRLLESLLLKRADLNKKNEKKLTPVLEAVKNKRLFALELLLKKGADVNELGGFPLIYAANNGHFDEVKLLYDYGAEIDLEKIYARAEIMDFLRDPPPSKYELVVLRDKKIDEEEGQSFVLKSGF